MKARDLIGKTIRRVSQSTESCWNGCRRATTIDFIEFDDGTRLRFRVLEHQDQHGYGVLPMLYRPTGIEEHLTQPFKRDRRQRRS